MKYWTGFLTAGIIAAVTWALMRLAENFNTLVDMVYPYFTRTALSFLAEWSSGVSFCLWQMAALLLGIGAVASIVVMIVMKWNPVRWLGWIAAGAAAIYFLNTLVFGLNYYAGPLADDVRLEVVEYNVEELTEAAEYYRDKANALASQVGREADGSLKFSDFDTLAAQAGDGFRSLTYDRSFSVFAGSTLPVKKLSWANFFTSRGITGVTIGITGEASVNPQIPAVSLPFTICHEMAHRMCIATERDGNFAGFLACQANESPEFQYSAYFMAFRYCYNALMSDGSTEASAAAARVGTGMSEELYRDLEEYNQFFDAGTVRVAAVTTGTEGVKSYGPVCDLLVSWHIQEVVLPSIAVEETPFDPYDESQVDLSGIVNARPAETEGE